MARLRCVLLRWIDRLDAVAHIARVQHVGELLEPTFCLKLLNVLVANAGVDEVVKQRKELETLLKDLSFLYVLWDCKGHGVGNPLSMSLANVGECDVLWHSLSGSRNQVEPHMTGGAV